MLGVLLHTRFDTCVVLCLHSCIPSAAVLCMAGKLTLQQWLEYQLTWGVPAWHTDADEPGPRGRARSRRARAGAQQEQHAARRRSKRKRKRSSAHDDDEEEEEEQQEEEEEDEGARARSNRCVICRYSADVCTSVALATAELLHVLCAGS